ncbi:MAG: GNAT family N-acetyltransferase [Lachnospiraceae bacterium]
MAGNYYRLKEEITDAAEQRALDYLEGSVLHNIDMIEPIRRKTTDIIYAQEDGVVLKELNGNVYMFAMSNIKKSIQILEKLKDVTMLTVHEKEFADYIKTNYNFNESLVLYNFAKLDKEPFAIQTELTFRNLRSEECDVVYEYYNVLEKEELMRIIQNGNLYGAFLNGTLIGFAGEHLEGSLGLLEILPAYRRKGYAMDLEAYIANQMMERGGVPFGQVVVDNNNSMQLQKKIGLPRSEKAVYWFFQ